VIATRSSSVRDDAATKKRLGQYFTSESLARLLAGLADAHRATSVLDPMVGRGDMLAGAVASGARPQVLAGIDIDDRCVATARARLKGPALARSRLVHGDAFTLSTMGELPSLAWDLVITNPPYVRYQSTSSGDAARFPSASEVRAGLLGVLDHCDALSGDERVLFRHLTATYSGLADLAVPAWLLCAALVAPGGTLAMIVPDTWLSRDYAGPIQYLLARCFDVRFVVRDSDAVWFSDALVRTTLVVADRVSLRRSAFEQPSDAGFMDISVRREAGDTRSLVGELYPEASDPNHAFASDAHRWRAARSGPASGALDATWVPATHTAALLNSAARGRKWFEAAESLTGRRQPTVFAPTLPLRVKRVIGRSNPAFVGLDTLGWKVGQGLRTGANAFFYGEAKAERANRVELVMSRRLGGSVLGVSADAALPVVRNQGDLPGSFTVRPEAVSGRVLVLSKYALPEDAERDRETSSYRVIEEELADFVRGAARINIGSAASPRIVSQLSAVITNVRPAKRNGSLEPARYWYQLPDLAARHRPALFVPRVNHGHPVTFLNFKRATVIDANFSTLWRATEIGPATSFAMLALLNSAWVRSVLELSATVLGGGALKVEASHLRRLPIPVMSDDTWHQLERFGEGLARRHRRGGEVLLRQIDDVVTSELTSRRRASPLGSDLREIAAAAAAGRRR
jgi:tRNA G10  N-methylase Trm11